MTSPVANVGLIGCGNISDIYLEVAQRLGVIAIIACADLDRGRAEQRAAEFGVPRVYTPDELLADSEIEVVINLTPPAAHFSIAQAALASGKHVYNEKPLAIRREDGKTLVEMAQARGLRLGGAPDTFLGAGLQTCRDLIDGGAIGTPVAATAFMTSHGTEAWHPDPEFFYKVGGGPMFDMGPYYLTALVSLLGPIQRVTGATRISFPERRITSQPKHGQIITVEVPTHVTGLLEFAAGPIATIVTSFDVWGANLPRIEIYGSEGTLSVPDPNTFGGPIRLLRGGTKEWVDMPLTHPYAENSRGLGVADLALAVREGRPHRANGDLTFHVLDVMHAIHEAAAAGARMTLASTCERPAPFPPDALGQPVEA
jgi:predicted dehydrogenase